jgi:hypothetical protein
MKPFALRKNTEIKRVGTKFYIIVKQESQIFFMSKLKYISTSEFEGELLNINLMKQF